MNGFTKMVQDKRTYSMGIAVGIATWLLAYIVSFFKIVNVLNIGGQRVTTGALSLNIGTTAQSMGTANALGVKAMAFLTSLPIAGGFIQGLIDNFMNGVIVVIGSVIIVGLGRWIYSFKIMPKGRAKWKLAIELLYGAIVGSVIIGGIGMVGISAFVTLAIYYVIVAFVVTMLARLKWYARLIRE